MPTNAVGAARRREGSAVFVFAISVKVNERMVARLAKPFSESDRAISRLPLRGIPKPRLRPP